MTPEQVQITLGIIAVAGPLAAALITFIATRGKTKTDAKSALDARIDARVTSQLESAWDRINDLESKIEQLEKTDRQKSAAFARILRSIAAQWPGGGSPDLDPADIADIDETIPPHWIRPRKATP